MKKTALVVTTALAFTLMAARLHAEKAGASRADRAVSRGADRAVSRHVTSNGSRGREGSTALARPTYRIRGSQGGSGALRGGDYALYGWTWGPGTAYRDGPPKRF